MSRERGIFVSTRRGVSAMLIGGAVATLSAPLAALAKVAPPTFDAAAFIADLRTAGVQAVNDRGRLYLSPDDGFTEAYSIVMARWAEAIKACPDWIERTVALATEYRVPEPA